MRKLCEGSALRTLVTIVAGLALATVQDVAGQDIPDDYTNLRILPDDISRQELVGIMRGYARALGGRCSACHMVSDELDQPTDDFASDEKATKRKARIMMDMVSRINTTILPSLPERREPNVDVTCNTCHGGASRPQSMTNDM